MEGRIHEIYDSLSGEGTSTGIPTVFVRFAGCSLRCGLLENKKLWCDTPYALGPKQGEALSFDQILSKILELDKTEDRQILFTGGEPLEGKNRDFVLFLSNSIYKKRKTNDKPFPLSRVETNGKESIEGLEHCVFSLDYKLPGSGMEEHMNLENLQILRKRHNYLDELKFVVRDGIDFQRSISLLSEFSPGTNVLYTPVFGELDPIELAEWIKKENPPKARLSLQIHKVIWGEKKGV